MSRLINVISKDENGNINIVQFELQERDDISSEITKQYMFEFMNEDKENQRVR